MKRKIVCLILAAVCAFGCFGCRKNKGGETPEEPSEPTYEFTGEYIVKDGKTDYKIVVPANADDGDNLAASELQELFEEATGIRLSIVRDSAVTTDDKLLSFGRTAQMAQSGVEAPGREYGSDGFKIVTAGDDVYMCGGESMGTVYAAYEFLWQTLHFDQFYADCYSLDKDVREIKLLKYNISEIPDIAYRSTSYGYSQTDSKVRRRMRLSGSQGGPFTPVNGKEWHNSFEWLSPETYGDNIAWFADDESQLCYTAHGNEEELEKMLNACLERFKTLYAGNPTMKVITLTQQDVSTWCTCPACSAEKAKYGTDSAVVIKFLNRLSKKIETYVTELNASDPDFIYDIDLLLFAYNSTTVAPASYDEATDTYSPMDDSVIMDPHVSVFYAPIYLDYTKSIYDTVNLMFYRNMYAWSALSNKMYLWTYETDFRTYMTPYDTFNGMQDLFKVLKDINAVYIFNQSQWNNAKGSTAWHMLKAYLNSKLSWNSNADMNELINRYFDAMYGPASGTMNEFFLSSRTYFQKLQSEGKYQGQFSIYTESCSTDYWSFQILAAWENYINKAFEDIEPLKMTDPELYNSYYDHIRLERVSVNFLMLELYEARISVAKARELYDNIINDCAACGITRVRESGLLSNWINTKVLIS